MLCIHILLLDDCLRGVVLFSFGAWMFAIIVLFAFCCWLALWLFVYGCVVAIGLLIWLGLVLIVDVMFGFGAWFVVIRCGVWVLCGLAVCYCVL